jgi:hypothetical protein
MSGTFFTHRDGNQKAAPQVDNSNRHADSAFPLVPRENELIT